jgi:hypothetical protein
LDAQKDDLSKLDTENGVPVNEVTNNAELPNNDLKDH